MTDRQQTNSGLSDRNSVNYFIQVLFFTEPQKCPTKENKRSIDQVCGEVPVKAEYLEIVVDERRNQL